MLILKSDLILIHILAGDKSLEGRLVIQILMKFLSLVPHKDCRTLSALLFFIRFDLFRYLKKDSADLR